MSKKLLLFILILLFGATGAACSSVSNPDTVIKDDAISSEYFDDGEEDVVEEPEYLEGEVRRDDDEFDSVSLTGEVDFDTFAESTRFDSSKTISNKDQEEGGQDRARVYNILAKNFEFVPNLIRVKQGNKVIISMTSEDEEHSFVVKEYGINQIIPVGESVLVEFVATKTGSFRFYSDIYSGVGSSNMRGTLIVSP